MAEDNDVVVVDPVDDDNAGAASSSEQKQYHPIFSCPVFFYKTGESEFGRKIKVEVQLNANANLSKAKNDIWWVKLKYFDYITLGRRIYLHEYAILFRVCVCVCVCGGGAESFALVALIGFGKELNDPSLQVPRQGWARDYATDLSAQKCRKLLGEGQDFQPTGFRVALEHTFMISSSRTQTGLLSLTRGNNKHRGHPLIT